MSPPGHERPRAGEPSPRGGRAETLARFRVAYLRLPPNLRFGLLCALVIGSGFLAVSVGWPLVRTAVLVALGSLVFVFAMAYPRGAASAAVLVGWLFAVPAMGLAYQRAATTGEVAADLAALVLLGVLATAASYLLEPLPPWKTALMALAAGGILGSLAVVIVPAAGVIPAYVAAAGVFGYRAADARRAAGRPARRPERRDAEVPEGPGPGSTGSPDSPDGRAEELPEISVEDALAELDELVGLESVKRQVRAIAAATSAARTRARAGYPEQAPMRHFVFVGPPGTGKTAVARVLARILYAFGLLQRPHLVEAQRADLVGEYVGQTAVKTNQLVDSALGGVLFIDEAYGLINQGPQNQQGQRGQSQGGAGGAAPGDAFGAEAVQTLLKRAEDERQRLIVILAGYERQMEGFLDANPGLNSRFGTRVVFPSYGAEELARIAEHKVAARAEQLSPEAATALRGLVEDVCRRGIVDDLGNGRFVRSLVDAAATARDLRVVEGSAETGSESATELTSRIATADDARPAAGAEELLTLLPGDLEEGYAEVTARFRGYAPTPSLDEALAELGAMVGLDPVKRQVRSIAAQLRVGRIRREQGIAHAQPVRHFVFAGPPGTGKTTVARTLGRVFAALGLLARPGVVEASRADLVGEYLGQTALKTNRVVDSALGGVLLVDEAYSLTGEGYSGGDAFGAEAVATLLERAEDDRENLVVILAGYAAEMERFLARNHGLASRFTTRVAFPSYTPDELRAIALRVASTGGDRWDESAAGELDRVLGHACGEGLIDRLGNGRFVRSLYATAGAARDLRLAERGGDLTPAELTTLTGADVRAAYAELAGPLGPG